MKLPNDHWEEIEPCVYQSKGYTPEQVKLLNERPTALINQALGRTVTLTLPFPPSVNGLFVNGRKGRFRSQKYDEWIQEAGWELVRQRPAKVQGRVVLSFTFEDHRKGPKFDISNRIKPAEDLLVSHGIIEADDCTIVRAVHASFSESVKGVKIEITSV